MDHVVSLPEGELVASIFGSGTYSLSANEHVRTVTGRISAARGGGGWSQTFLPGTGEEKSTRDGGDSPKPRDDETTGWSYLATEHDIENF